MEDQFKAQADTEYLNPQTGQKVKFSQDQLNTPGGAIGTLSSQFIPSAQNKPVMNASMDTNAFRKDLKTRDENVAQIAESNTNNINRRLDQKLNEMAKPYDINNDPYAKQQQDLYQNRMQQTDQRLVEDINRTNEQYAQNREQTEQVGRQNEGRLKSALARVGALGATPIISAGAMSSESMNTQKSLNSLLLEQQQAIQGYNRAKEDGDFELMNKMYDIARNAQKDYEAKQQQELENILGVSQEKRAQEQQQRDAIRFEREGLTFEQQQEDRVRQQTQSQLDALIAGGVPLIDPETGQANISPEEIAQLEQNLGLLPGTFENYYNNLYEATLAEQAGKQTEADIKRIEALKDIPEGTTVIIGGKEYQGLKPKEEAEDQKPITLSEGSILVDPRTGEVVAINPKTGAYDPLPTNPTTGKARLPQTDVLKMNKEIAQSGEYQALQNASAVWDTLENYEQLFDKYGNQKYGSEAKELESAYNATLLQMKEMFNLGVLNGPDLELMEKILPNPNVNFFTDPIKFTQMGGEAGMKAGIEQARGVLADKLIQVHENLNSSYGQFDESQLTNLQNIDRVFNGFLAGNSGYMIEKYIKDNPTDEDLIVEMLQEGTKEEVAQLLFNPPTFYDRGGDTGLFTDDLTLSQNGSNELGSLSEKYESGGDPGAIGYDSTGGYSYGAYQLAHNNAKRFVESSKYASEFEGIPFNSQQFQNKWKEVAQRDPQGFKAEQKAYIGQTHYQPQLDKIAKETGLNVNRLSPAMQDVIWSTAVQHGANTDIVINALKQLGRNATEEQVINKIYDLRWSGGQQFRSSTQQVKNSVKKRFDSERQLALSKLRNSV